MLRRGIASTCTKISEPRRASPCTSERESAGLTHIYIAMTNAQSRIECEEDCLPPSSLSICRCVNSRPPASGKVCRTAKLSRTFRLLERVISSIAILARPSLFDDSILDIRPDVVVLYTVVATQAVHCDICGRFRSSGIAYS